MTFANKQQSFNVHYFDLKQFIENCLFSLRFDSFGFFFSFFWLVLNAQALGVCPYAHLMYLFKTIYIICYRRCTIANAAVASSCCKRSQCQTAAPMRSQTLLQISSAQLFASTLSTLQWICHKHAHTYTYIYL